MTRTAVQPRTQEPWELPLAGHAAQPALEPAGEDPDARIAVAGDFNAAPEEVQVLAIRGDWS